MSRMFNSVPSYPVPLYIYGVRHIDIENAPMK